MSRDDENKLSNLLSSSAYTDDDIDQMQMLLAKGVSVTPTYLPYVQFRATLELIQAIRRFDSSSAASSGAANKLARRVLVLTIITVVVGLIGAVSSGWYPLTAWLRHIFPSQ